MDWQLVIKCQRCQTARVITPKDDTGTWLVDQSATVGRMAEMFTDFQFHHKANRWVCPSCYSDANKHFKAVEEMNELFRDGAKPAELTYKEG